MLVMAQELSERQRKILKSVIEEYIETAEPVGSATLEKKYSLNVSPATIRNEMVALTEAGYLRQPHTSAGRTPTPQGLKFYIDQLMEERGLSVAEEVSAKEKVWDYRHEFDRLMREVTHALAEQTHTLALAATQGNLYHAGYANILDMPEFYDIDVTRTVLSLLEEAKRIEKIFQSAFGEEPIHILFGEELGQPFLEPVGMVFTEFKAGERSGSLGVIGPVRLNFSRVVPTVRYFGNLIDEIAKEW